VDTDVAAELQAILVADGTELAADPGRVELELTEFCPDRPQEIALLVAAADQGAASALLERTPQGLDERVADLGRELAGARNLSPEAAEWAVRTWAFALGTGTRPPGPLPVPRAAGGGSGSGGAGRGRLLLVGAAVVALAVALVVVVPQLIGGSDDQDNAGPTGAQGSSPQPSSPPAPAKIEGLTVVAHQGGDETHALETLSAFVSAAKAGAASEADVQFTADGVAVVVHDEQIPGTGGGDKEHPMVCKGGPYTVSQTNWSVLREKCRSLAAASENGHPYHIPTYDETVKALAALPGAQLVAEMRPLQPTAAQVRQYLATITTYDMADRVIVSSSSAETLASIQAQAAKDKIKLRYLLLLGPSGDENLPTPDELARQGLWGVALRWDIATRGNIAGLHAKQLKVVVWTIDTPDQWNAARLGQADLVLTNKPTAYLAWLP
jgi:glycerophosphoryl diester phosphodiesterase